MTAMPSPARAGTRGAVAPELVRDAMRRIEGHVRRTPLLHAGEIGGARVVLKLESQQRSGSFKIRGAFSRILAAGPRPRSVTAASGGNHGIAVATAAAQCGIESTIYVPASSPAHKARLIEEAGGRLVRVDGAFPLAERAARERAHSEGATFIHPFDDPYVVAGQGTVGLEIMEDEPTVDTVVVAVGGGGLAAGVAVAVAGRAELLAVEPTLCPTLTAARAAGRPTVVAVGGVAADSLGAPALGEIAWQVLAAVPRDPVLVDEEAILAAQEMLWREFRIAAEPAAGCGLAALRALPPALLEGRSVAVIVCGANLDPRAPTEEA